MTTLLYLIFLHLNIFRVETTPPFMDNVVCETHEGVIAVDAPLHRYNPYFVKLQHCQGADTSPIGRVCSPTKEQKMNISVMKDNGMGFEIITVSKHIECSFICKDNASSCTRYQSWNDDSCSCDCVRRQPDCGVYKQWEQSSCNCFCSTERKSQCSNIGKEIEFDTCECIPTGKSTSPCGNVLAIKYVVTIMFVELLVVASICALIFLRFFYNGNQEKPEETRLTDINDKGGELQA